MYIACLVDHLLDLFALVLGESAIISNLAHFVH